MCYGESPNVLRGILNEKQLLFNTCSQHLWFIYVYIQNEYSNSSKLVLSGLLPFSTSYLCEVDFSVLNEIKNKKKKRKIT